MSKTVILMSKSMPTKDVAEFLYTETRDKNYQAETGCAYAKFNSCKIAEPGTKWEELTPSQKMQAMSICKNCGYGQNGEWHPLLAFACGSGVNHTGCPQCARLNASHSRMKRIRKCTTKPIISVGYPQIAAMWHPTANKFRPDELTAGSGERIALVCPDCGYGKDGEWTPLLFTVCKYGPKCSACRKVRR